MPDTIPRTPADEAFDASVFDDRAPSVGHLLRQRIADTPESTAYSFPAGIAWDELTWAQLGDRVWSLAAEPQQALTARAATAPATKGTESSVPSGRRRLMKPLPSLAPGLPLMLDTK